MVLWRCFALMRCWAVQPTGVGVGVGVGWRAAEPAFKVLQQRRERTGVCVGVELQTGAGRSRMREPGGVPDEPEEQDETEDPVRA